MSLGQDLSKTGKGKVVCDNCALSKLAPADLPQVLNPPIGPGRPGVPAADDPRPVGGHTEGAPRERWGGPGWVASYQRRTRVAGGFALLKNERTGNIKRGWTCQVGIIMTTLPLLAVAVTASNLRQLLV